MGSESTTSPGKSRSVRLAGVLILGLTLGVLILLWLVVETNYRPARWRNGVLTLEKKMVGIPGPQTRTRQCELESLRPQLEREGAWFVGHSRYPSLVAYHRDAAALGNPYPFGDEHWPDLYEVGFHLRAGSAQLQYLEEHYGFGPKTLHDIRDYVGFESPLFATPNLDLLLSDPRSVALVFGGR